MKAPKDNTSLKFETVMENLQTIVEEMESGDLPLDDLIGRYEEGMKLVKISRDKLAQAEQKIEVLTRTQTNELTSKIPTSSESDDDQKKTGDVSLF